MSRWVSQNSGFELQAAHKRHDPIVVPRVDATPLARSGRAHRREALAECRSSELVSSLLEVRDCDCVFPECSDVHLEALARDLQPRDGDRLGESAKTILRAGDVDRRERELGVQRLDSRQREQERVFRGRRRGRVGLDADWEDGWRPCGGRA